MPAEPRPGLTPPACEATGTKCEKATGGWWDLFDIPGMIVNAITAFLGMLVEQVMKPVRELLADTLLSTPDVTRQADVRRLWTGSLGIAAGIYVLFVTAGGLTVMGYETFQTRYALKQIAPRVLVGMIAAATSLTVMGKAISLANALSHAVMRTDTSDAGKGLVERVIPFALFGAAGLNLYLLVLAIIMVVLALAVLMGYIVRVAVIALLAVSAPLALSCHAHPVTDSLARMWWRALAGCLTIQVAQSMTLVVALKLFFAPGATLLGFPKPSQLGTMLAGLALFWFLFKIPGWCLRSVFRSSPVSLQAPAPLRMLQSVAMWRLMNRAVPGLGALRLAGTGRGGGGGGGPGGRGAPPGGPRGGGGRGGGGRPGGGGGPGRPRGPGGVAGFAVRRGRALVAGVRARAAVVATAAGAAAGGRPAAPAGSSPARHGGAPAGSSRTPGGSRSVIHPVQARCRQQLALPIPANRVPARPGRPAQLRLPITVQRVPRTATVLPGGVPSTGPGVPGAPPSPATAPPAAPSPLGRRLRLGQDPCTSRRARPARPHRAQG
ncbi:hypothetical protein ACIOFV_03070 [Streptomyces mirabilis]|uniref:hypothetical protein n=1 Tax=Streptomyces mirabilis TaxID=68239 RepID=UPI0038251993